MQICIDITPAVHGHAGLGRYTYELTSALLDLAGEDQYSAFYIRPGAARPLPPLDRLPAATSEASYKGWRLRVLISYLAGRPQDRALPPADIFHATGNVLPHLISSGTVFTLHDLIFCLYPQGQMPLNRWYLTLMMPRFLRAADRIIAVSEQSRRDAIRLYGIEEAKIRVIYEGVHPRFRPAAPAAIEVCRQRYGLPTHYLLYVGVIEPRKNLNLLLEAYSILKGQGFHWPLVIVGKPGWLHKPFFRRRRTLGLEKDILLPGFIPDEDLPAVYSGACLFVFPSLYEGFGLPVLEAMACGTPVICSNTSSLPEVAGEAALLVPPDDVRRWVEAIERATSDPAWRAERGAAGQRQAARFTWSATAVQTRQVYEEVYAARQTVN